MGLDFLSHVMLHVIVQADNVADINVKFNVVQSSAAVTKLLETHMEKITFYE